MNTIKLILGNVAKKNKLSIVLSLILGLLAINIVSSVSFAPPTLDSSATIGVIDNDKSAITASFKKYFEDELNITIIDDVSTRELEESLINYKASAIITIPDGFHLSLFDAEAMQIDMRTLDDFENSAFLSAYIDIYFNSIKTVADVAGSEEKFAQILATDSESITIEINNNISQDIATGYENMSLSLACGFITMVLLLVLTPISINILTDKSHGIYNRIQLSPVNYVQYILGSSLFGFILTLIPVGMFSGYLFLFMNDTGVDLVALSICLVLFATTMVGLTVLIALICNSVSAVWAWTSGISTLTSLIGGAWFPIDESVGIIANLSYFTPTYWVVSILGNYGFNSSANFLPNILVLLLFNVMVYLLCVLVFTKVKQR